MLPRFTNAILAAACGLGIAATASAQQQLVFQNISTSTTWTANNTYNMIDQIYVLPGATLTIEAGTVVASATNVGGSLAVTRGAQINIQGTPDNPVIFTSTADVATWAADGSHPTGGNPKTGSWRAAANEWGNITIMGSGYISENATLGNVPTCSASNTAAMEGLVAGFPGDPNVIYGGGNDDDDSGSISYLTLRYGGRVIGLNNELNGLSLGGIGRGTDIHHLEIMNNVDDGIEIWGGTVNIKYFSIWNIGDDSLDIDQGWRGKGQFGLIVQGYSLPAATQGSGVGDNACEIDGAEDSDWQPVTTTSLYNMTVIGQPVDGDGLTTWRDNARVQYRNCIFMDGGDAVVRFDNVDGDGANGYGHNGTLSWPATWTTAFNGAPAHPNDCPASIYPVQQDGNLAEIKDSVFFGNTDAAAYGEALARGVFNPSNNNVQEPAGSPIAAITRAAPITVGTLTMSQVTFLDPRPANDALTSVGFAPNDGFFSSAKYRGAFAPGNNWLGNWSASRAFGFTPAEVSVDIGNDTTGANGYPVIAYDGTTFSATNGVANGALGLFFGASRFDFPIFGGILVPLPFVSVTIPLDGNGETSFNLTNPGARIFVQGASLDLGAPQSLSFSNALQWN